MDLEVNKRIKEARKKLHYTQGQVAEYMGMKCSTYSQMERKGSISVERAKKLAEILNADPDYIIYGQPKSNAIDFSPEKTVVLPVNDPQSFLDKIKNGQEELVLTNSEKNIIKNYRTLKDSDKKDVWEYIQSKTKK